MNLDLLLEEKQPPAGGLFRLRHRLRQDGRKHLVRRRVLAWGACVLVLLGIGIGIDFNQTIQPKAAVLNLMPMFLDHDLPVEQVQVKNGTAIKVFESDTVVYFKVIQF